MSQLFARVELLGSPDEKAYEQLHQYMSGMNWYKKISGVDLPHAVYQAQFQQEHPDLLAVANGLKAEIQRMIWTRALILIVRSVDWAKTAA